MSATFTDRKTPLSDFIPAMLDYRFNSALGGFEHGFDRDLHMFVLWEKSADQWQAIREDLEARFTVLHATRITWTPKRVDDNFLRLYGMAPTGSTADQPVSKRSQTVGGGPFMLLVVEDPAPVYFYDRTFSKKVELVNGNVAQAKARYRAMTGGGFKIHSSNSLGEFFRDCTLLLGAETVHALLARREAWRGEALPLSTDLAGAAGWPSLQALFEHLRRTCLYAVLRNFEPLPGQLPDGDADLDLLCRDAADLAAVANARIVVAAGGKFACETDVAGRALHLDLRVVGDGYYDDRWQLRMLQASQAHGGCVTVLSPDDHFFSLLYHAKVHKRSVSESYRRRLPILAAELGLYAYREADFADDKVAAGLLAGFLVSRDYRCTTPLDVWVNCNGAFMERLNGEGLIWERERERDTRRVAAVLARAPVLWRFRRRLSTPVAMAYRAMKKRAWRSA
jgi:hypothetical protein